MSGSKTASIASEGTGKPKSGGGGSSKKKKKDYPHTVRVRVLGLAGVVVKNDSPEDKSVLPPTKMRAVVTLSRDNVLQGESHLSLPLSRSPNEDIVTPTSRDDASSVAGASLVSLIRRGTGRGGFEVSAGQPAAVERYLAVWEQETNSSETTLLTFETNLQRCESSNSNNQDNGDEESISTIASSMYAPKSFEITVAMAPSKEDERRQIAFPLGVATLAISGDERPKDGAPRQFDLPVLSLEQARPVVGPVVDKESNKRFPIIDLASSTKEIASLQHPVCKEEEVPTQPRMKGKQYQLKKVVSSGFKKLKRGKADSPKTMTPRRQREAFAKRYWIDSSGDAVLRLSVEVFESGSDPKKVAFLRHRREIQRLEAVEGEQTDPTITAIGIENSNTPSEPVRQAPSPPSTPAMAGEISNAIRTPDADATLTVTSKNKNENDGQDDENGSAGTGAGTSSVLTDEEGSRMCETMTTATFETGTTLEEDTLASTKASGLTDEKNATSHKKSSKVSAEPSCSTAKDDSQDANGENDDDTTDTSPTFITKQFFGQDVLVPAVAVEATEHLKSLAREAREQYSCADRSSPDGDSGSLTKKPTKPLGLVDVLLAGCAAPVPKKKGNSHVHEETSAEAQERRDADRGVASTIVSGEEQSRTGAESAEDETMETAGGDETMDSRDEGTFESSSMLTRTITVISNQSSPRGVKDFDNNVSEKSKESAQESKLTMKQSQKDSTIGSSSNQQKVTLVLQTIADVLTCRLNSPHPIDEINEASTDQDRILPPAIILQQSNLSLGDLTDNTFEYNVATRTRSSRQQLYETAGRFSPSAAEFSMAPSHGSTGVNPLPVAFGGDGLCATMPIATYKGEENGSIQVTNPDTYEREEITNGSRKATNPDEDYFADYHAQASKDFQGNATQDLKYQEEKYSVLNIEDNVIGHGGILPNDSDATDDDKYTALSATNDDKYTALK